jgi:anti-sigma B factor antagonist
LLVEVYPEKVTAVLLRSVGAALTITVYDSVGDGDRGGFERPHPVSRWAPVGAPYDLQVEKKRSPVGLLRASVSVPESAGAAYSVVVLAGEVDATNSDELYGVLESVVTQQPRLLIVDMSELSFMDSTGLRMLLRSSRSLDQQGGVLALAAPQVSVARVLQLTRADQLIPVYETMADAIADA